MKNERLKLNPIDIIIYTIFIGLTLIDFIFSINQDKDIFVCITFIIIGISSIIFFITDRGGVTVDKIIYIFMYLFCYYAPYHQYLDNYIIHPNSPFSESEFLFANIIILIFLFLYTFSKRLILKKVQVKKIKYDERISINELSLTILTIISIVCLIILYKSKLLFSTNENIENSDGIYITMVRMTRFFPVASLLIYIFANKDKLVNARKINKKIFIVVIALINLIIYFPLNGTVSRYLLFGTYIMIFFALSNKLKYKSLILVVASIGFYVIFPAFNFFKNHTIFELSEFRLGGFSTNYIDYDAYQVLMLSVRYAKSHGVLYGANILSGILCIVPRSIFTKKLYPSGQIVAEYFNFKFLNISCPLFAEFYIAGGVIAIIFGTILFSLINKIIENKMMNNNILFKGIYTITLGMMFIFMRGAFLPTMSMYLCLIIVYIVAYYICTPFKKKEVIKE